MLKFHDSKLYELLASIYTWKKYDKNTTNQEAIKQQHKTHREAKGETITSKGTKGWWLG